MVVLVSVMKGDSIPPLAWVIIGVIMAGYAWLTLHKTNNESMNLFIYIGILFVILGVIKYLLSLRKKPSKKTSSHHEAHQVHHPAQTHQQHHIHHKIIICPVCGAKNYSTSNYCHMCGAKLPKELK